MVTGVPLGRRRNGTGSWCAGRADPGSVGRRHRPSHRPRAERLRRVHLPHDPLRSYHALARSVTNIALDQEEGSHTPHVAASPAQAGPRPAPGPGWRVGAETVLSVQSKDILTPARGGHHDDAGARRPGLRCGQPPVRDPGRADQVPARPLPAASIDYVDVRGRTKIVVRGQISEYIPNPTFEVVARPGAQEEYFRVGNPEGKSRREIFGEPMRALPAFREPAARLELMDEQGLDRTLMFPTLASLVEERLRDDPELIHAVIHALNEWIYETWTVRLRGPHLHHAGDHACPSSTRPSRSSSGWSSAGARVVLIRPAPVPGFRGSRSFGLPEFDPFWEKVVEHDVLVAMHSSDSGYERYANEWMGSDSEMLPFQPQAFRMLSAWRPVEDAVSALVCHGALSAVPDAQGGGHRERQQLGGAAAAEPGRRLQEDAAGLPRGPGRGHQAQHLHQPVLGGGPGRAGRADRRRPRPVRVRLPPPRGPGRPGRATSTSWTGCPRRRCARSWAATWPA